MDPGLVEQEVKYSAKSEYRHKPVALGTNSFLVCLEFKFQERNYILGTELLITGLREGNELQVP